MVLGDQAYKMIYSNPYLDFYGIVISGLHQYELCLRRIFSLYLMDYVECLQGVTFSMNTCVCINVSSATLKNKIP